MGRSNQMKSGEEIGPLLKKVCIKRRDLGGGANDRSSGGGSGLGLGVSNTLHTPRNDLPRPS